MRIFVGISIDEAIHQRIVRFMDGLRAFAPDARWVRPESLHVTLKFIGEQPEGKVEEIRAALRSIRAGPCTVAFRGCGFFPTPKAARVFWVGVESGSELAELARTVDDVTSALGVPKEDRPFSPHLTLARGGRGSGSPRWKSTDGPNYQFRRLQEKLADIPAPEFGTMTAREFVLYQSQLMRGGSRYTKMAQFSLAQ